MISMGGIPQYKPPKPHEVIAEHRERALASAKARGAGPLVKEDCLHRGYWCIVWTFADGSEQTFPLPEGAVTPEGRRRVMSNRLID